LQALAAAPKRQKTRVLQENMGTSLLEYFNEQQIQTHVEKLRNKEGPVQGGCEQRWWAAQWCGVSPEGQCGGYG